MKKIWNFHPQEISQITDKLNNTTQNIVRNIYVKSDDSLSKISFFDGIAENCKDSFHIIRVRCSPFIPYFTLRKIFQKILMIIHADIYSIEDEWIKDILYDEFEYNDLETLSITRIQNIYQKGRELLISTIKQINDKRILILLENIDQADYSTLCFLNNMMRNLEEYKISFLFFCKDEKPSFHIPLNNIIDTCVRDTVLLPDIDVIKTKELLGPAYPETLIQRICMLANGKPYHVVELIKFLNQTTDKVTTSKIPATLEHLLIKNYSKLTNVQLLFLKYIAVNGEPLNCADAKKFVVSMTDEEIKKLEEQNWVAVEDDAVLISNDQLRDLIYHVIPEIEKKEIHLKIAEMLVNRANNESGYYELAAHFHNGGNIDKAIHYYFIAGLQALKKDALKECIGIFLTELSLLEYLDNPENSKIYVYIIEMLIKLSLYSDPQICFDTCKKYQRFFGGLQKDKSGVKNLLLASFGMISDKIFQGIITKKTDIDVFFNFEGKQEEKILFSHLQYLRALLILHKYNDAEMKIKEIEALVKDNKYLSLYIAGLKNICELQKGNVGLKGEEFKKIIDSLENQKIEKSKAFWWIYCFIYLMYKQSCAHYGKAGSLEMKVDLEEIINTYGLFDLKFINKAVQIEYACHIGRFREADSSISILYESLREIQFPDYFGMELYRVLIVELYKIGEFGTCKKWAERLFLEANNLGDCWIENEANLYNALSEFEIGNKELAVKNMIKLVETTKLKYPEQYMHALLSASYFYVMLRDVESAELYINECYPRIDEKDFENSIYQINYYMLLGWINLYKNQDEICRKGLMQALDIAQKNGNNFEEGKIHIILGMYHKKKGEEKESVMSFETASSKFIITDNKWWLAQVSSMREHADKIYSVKIKPDDMHHGQSITLNEQNEGKHSGALLEFSKMVVSSLDLNTILINVIEQCMLLVNAERGKIILQDEHNRNKVEIVRNYKNGAFTDGVSHFDVSNSVLNQMYKTGEAVCVEDAQANENFKNAESIKNLDIRTVVAMPLKSAEQIIGVIYIDRSGISSKFTAEEMDLLKSLSGYASMAVINANLHQQATERAERLQILNELSKSISSAPFVDNVIKQVLSYCVTVTKSDKGFMFLGNELEFKGGITSNGEEIKHYDINKSVSTTILRKVFLSGKSLILSDISEEKELASKASVKNLSIQSAMCVPMVANNQVIGVVYVTSEQINNQFKEKNLSILESIINQASLAVENAQLLENQRKYISDLEKTMKMYQKAQEKANKDLLTGLCNHGFFMDQINREFIMAKRYGTFFSVIFIDIDLFKEINDTYGHQAGDTVLKNVADTILKECRQTDIGARYGGDEMAIILSNTDSDGAFVIAERLRNEISNIKITDDKNVHVSVGVAQIQESDINATELLNRVDEALYNAKKQGRNKVCRWGDKSEVSIEEIKKKILLEDDKVDDMVSVLSLISSLKDRSTMFHSYQMGNMIVVLGKEYNIDRKQIEEIKMAALLHDIGKIGIPDEILKKEGLLTDEEWKIIRTHTILGENIVKQSKELKRLSKAIYYHHERWDGKGYPEGLKGEQIPLAARIITILDAFEAMVCDRPYRKAMSIDDAFAEIEKNAGTQFDPNLVRNILKHKELLKKVNERR